MKAYYNEFDKKPATWLRELGKRGLITEGLVDETSIKDLTSVPEGFARYHFFSGIGGWDYALKLSGWPSNIPVWTGSCPCQPFSTAGKGLGESDPRHLWPDFFRLISKHRPPIIFGEQVASAAGRQWLSGIRFDLETLGYAVGAADLCASGVGAPHIRQRLYWMAHSVNDRTVRRIGNSFGEEGARKVKGPHVGTNEARNRCPACRMAHAHDFGRCPGHGKEGNKGEEVRLRSSANLGNGGEAWSKFDLILCSDGKKRRIEPGLAPLAHGVPGRVGLLRGYGNAIVPQVAQVFIESAMEILGIEKEV